MAPFYWPRSVRVRRWCVEYVDTVARAETSHVCSTSISHSFPHRGEGLVCQAIGADYSTSISMSKGTFCTFTSVCVCWFESVLGSAIGHIHIPLVMKSVTKCPHLGVNDLDQGGRAQPWSRKQKATQTVCVNPTPSSLSLHHLLLRLANSPSSAVFVCFGSVPSPQEPPVDFAA